MQGNIFIYGLVGALAIALLVAAFTDIRRRQIDNWLNAAVALGARRTDRIEALASDTLSRRPALGKHDVALMLWRSIFM